jgi:large subunit ribosomal protein L5
VSDEPTAAPRKPAKPAAKKAAAPRKAVAPRKPAASAAKRSASAPEATPKERLAAKGGEPVGLRLRYRDEVVPALIREFRYANPMQVPRLEKVVVNIGLGEAIQNAKAIDAAVGDLATITGQKPIVTRATKSIAQFRLRTGMPVGAKVTLRGQRMYDFVERTLRLALPRIRDFRGVSPGSFDGRGNFSLGLREQLMYPEIDYDKIDRLRGLEISFVTTARNDEEGRRLLALLGMPFAAN